MFYQFEPIGDENTFQQFCTDLLNLIYNTKSFQTYKTRGATQHGVDMYSSEYLVAAQSKKKKLARADKTLEVELITDFDESIRLIKDFPFKFNQFILLSTSKKYGNVQNHALRLSEQNSFDVIFWSWEDIESNIAKYPELRKKYYPHLWHNDTVYPKILTYIPRVDENEIFGRGDDLTKLAALLEATNKVVLLNGIGGVGKSTVAKLFVNQNTHRFAHIAWIDVSSTESTDILRGSSLIDAFSNNIVLQRNLGLQFKEEMPVEEKFLLILNKLQNLDGLCLLVIDNAPNEILEFYDKLANVANWKVILTSREAKDDFALLYLEVLSDEAATALFYQHYKIEQDEQLSSILSYVGNHTLTIELLAKTANKRNLSIQELIGSLKKEGLNIYKAAKVTVSHDIKRNPTRPFEYLLKIFSIANVSNEQTAILRWFSILPSKFILYDDLIILFQTPEDDTEFFDNLVELTSKGWIREEKRMYQMHQVTQEVLRAKLLPDFENCQIPIKGITNLLSFTYKESFTSRISYLETAEYIIDNLFRDQKEFSTLINNVAVMHDYNGNSLSAVKYYEKLLSLNNKDAVDETTFSYYINLAVSWLRLGDYKKALFYNLRNIDFLEKSTKHQNSLELAMSYNNLAENYRHLGQFNKALEFNLKAIKIFESSEIGKEHAELATAYNNLSNSYSALENSRNSLKYGLIATKLRERHLDPEHPYLAQSYNNLGVDYEKLCDFSKSMEYHLKAIKIRESIYKEAHYDLAESYNNVAELFRAMENFDKAIYYHKKSIGIREFVFSKNHPEISSAYGNLAGVYLFQKDLINAGKYFSLAIDMRTKNGNIDPSLALFYFNYAVLQSVKGKLNDSLKFINKSIDIFSKTLRKSHPNYKTALLFKSKIFSRNTFLKNEPGRNDPCYCGSGKKYKTCCGKM